MSSINQDFLINAYQIKDEFPKITEFIDQHKYEFKINTTYSRSKRVITNLEALTIEKLFRDIFYYTQEFIDHDEILSPEEKKSVAEDKALMRFLDDWYKTQGIKN
jgi:hypothetical protein